MTPEHHSQPRGPGTPPAIVVMGVAGCGKSTIASRLADRFRTPYLEGDDVHPPANRAKMSVGIPLDDDRAPWLEAIAERIATDLNAGRGIVVACSALRRTYRERIRDAGDVWFAHLALDEPTATARVAARPGHFIPSTLIASQFAILQPLGTNEPGITIEATQPPDHILTQVQHSIAARVPRP
jgi:gluconokinase